jgi:hypothetical protein
VCRAAVDVCSIVMAADLRGASVRLEALREDGKIELLEILESVYIIMSLNIKSQFETAEGSKVPCVGHPDRRPSQSYYTRGIKNLESLPHIIL